MKAAERNRTRKRLFDMSQSNSLDKAREIITEADAEMAALFVKRMRAVQICYEHKSRLGLPILDREREKAEVEKSAALIADEVLRGYYVDFLKHAISLSGAYQARMQSGLRVAYSGVEGAFAHIAAGRIFPQSVKVSCISFRDAYEAVLNGDSDVAVLPVENSYAGIVSQVVDLIFDGELFINGIYEMEIRQNLLGVPGASAKDIRKVISHPQALVQCREYILGKGFQTQEASNTAVAAREVAAANDQSLGAIASHQTAQLYGLQILEEDIHTDRGNTTRFAVLSGIRAESPLMDRSILLFTVRNKAGSLAEAIAIIGKYGYNMTSLHSMPLKRHAWEYYFYTEIDGTFENEQGRKMLEELKAVCERLRVAGSFAARAAV